MNDFKKGTDDVIPSKKQVPPFKKQFKTPKPAEEWIPATDLGRLVKDNRITLDEIFKHSMRIKEPEIVNFLVGSKLKEEILCIKSVQKQTKAGQRTRMKVVMAVGDGQGYVGLGSKSAKELAVAIRGAVARAKCALRPVRLGYWGSSYGEPHTVPCKVTGKCGSVAIKLIPAPKGSGIRAGTIPRKIFQLAGVKDVFTISRGQTSTTQNFAGATIAALDQASSFFVPSMWEKKNEDQNPLLKHSKVLENIEEKWRFTKI
ncbi:ribosomal protein S2 [Hamiltosporidium magnivora]|uniref:Small ribosomal subunit protein uS5 n=1 Tax=Hamiltosporidium magnivora TaxID=148818 RepID=A0A4Q9LEW6_9MICR|nr:ribosomal protein S2 [Hamiltosporidium magnivora]